MFSFFNKNKANISDAEIISEKVKKSAEPHYVSEIMEDENGKYRIIKHWGKEDRQTHIKGILKGKYRGEFEREDSTGKFYKIEIYESELLKVEKLNEVPPYDEIKRFPKESLPEKISTCIKNGSDFYHINIFHPQFTDSRNISQKLQQTDGEQSFGVIEGEIFGYIKDEVDVEKEEKIYLLEPDICKPTLEPTGNTETDGHRIRKEYWCDCKTKTYWGNWEDNVLIKTDYRTGKKEFKDNYFREEFWYQGKKQKYWGDWKYKNNNIKENIGCGSILSFLLWAFLLIIFFPYIIYFLPFLILGLIIHFFRPLLKYLIWIVGILFFMGFISGIFHSFNTPKSIVNIPEIKDEPTETRTVKNVEDKKNPEIKDSIITHFRKWKDYGKNEYQGIYSIKMSDLRKSHQFKNRLPESEYDYFIHSLKENDKNELSGVYRLFDNLKKENKLNSLQFSEMLVSFVQDIPYALVLDKDCNPSQYSDNYIKEYFKQKNASCDPNQRYGINSPVEFLANLKGDCDTRTLLLYTILDHYGFDVLLLTSNFYKHSILAVNLPVNRQQFKFYGKNYTVWETTTFLPPGIIPMEISDQNKWEITLKSNNYGKQ